MNDGCWTLTRAGSGSLTERYASAKCRCAGAEDEEEMQEKEEWVWDGMYVYGRAGRIGL